VTSLFIFNQRSPFPPNLPPYQPYTPPPERCQTRLSFITSCTVHPCFVLSCLIFMSVGLYPHSFAPYSLVFPPPLCYGSDHPSLLLYCGGAPILSGIVSFGPTCKSSPLFLPFRRSVPCVVIFFPSAFLGALVSSFPSVFRGF